MSLRRSAAFAFLLLATAAAGPATTRATPSFRLQVTSTLGGDAGAATIVARGDWARIDHADGRIRVERYDTREAITLDPANRLATVREYFPDPPTILELARNPPVGTPIGEREIDGRSTRGVERVGDGVFRGGIVRIWSGVDTGRPVRIEITAPNKPGAAVTFERFEFDVPLDDALFSIVPPAGFTVEQGIGIRPDRLRPAATTQEAATLTLVPRVGLGTVRFGMSYDQIVAAIGPPDQRLGGQLCYFSRGFTLLIGGEDRLHHVSASAASKVPFSASRDFPGQTDKGVRIGSTRADVIAAYGEPTEVTRRERERLSYQPDLAEFEIDGDRVVGIRLSRPEVGR